MKKVFLVTGLVACSAILAACDVPDMRGFPIRGGSPAPSVGPGPVAPSGGMGSDMGAPSSSVAEQACMAAGRDAGFSVQGVVGTREVTGADGLASSRDVMLGVSRSGQSLEVRCSYSYASASARIMTL